MGRGSLLNKGCQSNAVLHDKNFFRFFQEHVYTFRKTRERESPIYDPRRKLKNCLRILAPLLPTPAYKFRNLISIWLTDAHHPQARPSDPDSLSPLYLEIRKKNRVYSGHPSQRALWNFSNETGVYILFHLLLPRHTRVPINVMEYGISRAQFHFGCCCCASPAKRKSTHI